MRRALKGTFRPRRHGRAKRWRPNVKGKLTHRRPHLMAMVADGGLLAHLEKRLRARA